mmetsp:Transcript_43842/g.99090  ORF Transcript_43842/g.99090 Transcript_43842/m.99090 type:complete len:205 (+) Transcript_43842:657-1271(+)
MLRLRATGEMFGSSRVCRRRNLCPRWRNTPWSSSQQRGRGLSIRRLSPVMQPARWSAAYHAKYGRVLAPTTTPGNASLRSASYGECTCGHLTDGKASRRGYLSRWSRGCGPLVALKASRTQRLAMKPQPSRALASNRIMPWSSSSITNSGHSTRIALRAPSLRWISGGGLERRRPSRQTTPSLRRKRRPLLLRSAPRAPSSRSR